MQELIHHAVEAAPNAVLMVDVDGQVVLVNAQTEKLFGYSRQELLGQPVEHLVPERFRAGHPEHRRSFFVDPQARSMGAGRDLYGLCSDGSEVPIEIGLNPITTEAGTFALASIIDITERKRAEQRFQLVVEAAPNAMLMMDVDGQIVLVNAQTEKLFGYSREELLGQPVEHLVPERFRAGHPEHRRSFFVDPQARSMGAGRDLYGLCSDGSEVPIEIGLNPITTEAGTFALASIIDITARKRADKDLRAAKAVADSANIDLKERVQLLELGGEIGLVLVQKTSLQVMLQSCTQAIVRHLDAAFARIWTLSECGEILELQASDGLYTHTLMVRTHVSRWGSSRLD
jgi:PAS domain S-box-containing protein